ncbi:MAG: phosphoribosylaminoimidazolesuccinocarboxamide synthase [Alphaproteobacteria bacterium]|nr:phosphoribosylaminoimidazolesuccinocarboxamide synthase [Alphaproteobacteria bacterium]
MSTRQHLYDGKAKTIFAGPDAHHLIQYFKDDATAYNAVKHDVIMGKGILNNLISEHIMGVVAKAGVDTHFVERLNEREQLIRKVEIVPVEVVVRNIASGSLVKRLSGDCIPVKDGDTLPAPLLEYYLKEDALNDPIIAAKHITTFGLASADELARINSMTATVNTVLTEMFMAIGIRLIDFKLEFGRLPPELGGEIILADEISPDNCRLWDVETGEKKDKDRFRQDLGGLIEAYTDIASRFGLNTAALSTTGADQ